MNVSQWLNQLDFAWLLETVITVLAALLCITFHETCHGLMALWLGDKTAKNQKRLTLNPLHHVDILGLLMMAVFKFGWAKPVPVNMRNFKSPKWGMALTALAGPLSNLILAFLAMLIYFGLFFFVPDTVFWSYMLMFFSYTAVLSIGLTVFNLIPIPPLDGSKVLFSLLPNRVYETLMRYEKYGMILLMLVLYTGLLDVPLLFLRTGLLNLLQDGAIFLYRPLIAY